jgi:hypothetical protein
MGKIANTAESLRRRARAIAHLMSTTALQSPPERLLPDHAHDRIAIGQTYLGRSPQYLRHPMTGQVFWVESEPDDWRDLLAQAETDFIVRAARKGRMH